MLFWYQKQSIDFHLVLTISAAEEPYTPGFTVLTKILEAYRASASAWLRGPHMYF